MLKAFTNRRYDPPMSIEEIKKKGYSHLLKDPIHRWRAEQGIELIHKEPTLEELERIWENWQLMLPKQKELSDQKSKEFFGMTNKEHYEKLRNEEVKAERKGFTKLASTTYVYGVTDTITGEIREFDSLFSALSYIKTNLGGLDSQLLDFVLVRKFDESGWTLLQDEFGPIEISPEDLIKIPEFKQEVFEPTGYEKVLNDQLKQILKRKKQDEKDLEINEIMHEGEQWKKGTSLEKQDWQDQGEDWKKEGVLVGFTKEGASWTDKELQILKTVYKQARDKGIPHNQIYNELANYIPHSMRGIKQKLESLYKQDDELKNYKFEHWSRDKIIEEIKKIYESGAPISRRALPAKLEYQITNHSLPKAITRGFEVYFDSFDHAIAEALVQVGYERTEGQLDLNRPLKTIDDAWYYYRGNEKINNPWTKKEIIRLFEIAHAAGLPLTKSFFTSHADVYMSLLGINKSLDGLRKSIDRLGLTWGELVTEAVPDYKEWYNEDGKPQVSMGELRVRRFLDLHNIPYEPTTRQDKIPVIEEELIEAGYKNFIPDLFILDDSGNRIGLVEVYGAIANSSAASGELAQKYQEKIEAKNRVYEALPLDYIAIHDNELFGSDLSNESLQAKFAKYIPSIPSSIDNSNIGSTEIEANS